MFSGMVLVVLLFTALVMSNSGLRYARSQQDARCTLSLDYARILIEKDQSYMDGLTEYYISSSEAQELVKLSNAGQEVPRERSQELLQSARFKMSLLSVVFFNVKGEPIDFVAIDNSYGPVPQSGQETERPFDRLMNSYNSMEWEYVPRYSTVFMEMDHSPKIVLWKKIEDSNTQRAIGVIAVSLDVRKLLGSNMDAHSASNTLLLSYDGEVALNRTGYELPGELVAGICAGAGGGPGVRSCLDLLRYYLELQRHRFGSRIQWKIEADREIYDALIPRLILQPLVENCIIHGMDSAGANFFIYIEARMSEGGEDLNFLVEDNGVGFPEELLACWPDRLDEYFKAERPDTSGGQRFALRNIYERLKIRYQERGEFSIRNRPGGGASVFLSLPNDYKEV